jgi:formamidopyrimidine-DNA glycosylase
MPELPEVAWYHAQWDVGRGQPIVDLALHARKRVFRGSNARELRRLIGQTLVDSEARGKRMVFRFGDNKRGRENLRSWLGIHLGMTGKLHVAAANFRPAKHDHLVLYQRDRALVFTDSRQFGRVRFHHGPDAPAWWDTGVPEIGSTKFNRCWLDLFLDRHGKAPIKAVLLMQHGFSGIGNWMADEILWRAHILPARLTSSLTCDERGTLLKETKFIVRRSIQTIGQNADAPRGWLIHERWSPTGRCPKHGTALQHATIGGRTTAWCARCQR